MRISVCSLDSHNIWKEPEGFRVKKATGSWWRDKVSTLLWSLLHRLKTVEQYGFYEKSYYYTEAHQESVAKLILKGVDEIFKRNGRVEDYCIVLGAKDFADLMDGLTVRDQMEILSGRIAYQHNGYKAEFRGLPVHVVPNLSGTAVIPKVLVEKRIAA